MYNREPQQEMVSLDEKCSQTSPMREHRLPKKMTRKHAIWQMRSKQHLLSRHNNFAQPQRCVANNKDATVI